MCYWIQIALQSSHQRNFKGPNMFPCCELWHPKVGKQGNSSRNTPSQKKTHWPQVCDIQTEPESILPWLKKHSNLEKFSNSSKDGVIIWSSNSTPRYTPKRISGFTQSYFLSNFMSQQHPTPSYTGCAVLASIALLLFPLSESPTHPSPFGHSATHPSKLRRNVSHL